MLEPITKAGDPLLVSEMFQTVQGEGFYQGKPATFVRLQGCSVGCKWCFAPDTKVLMSDWTEKLIADIKRGDYVMGYRNRSYVPSLVVDEPVRRHSVDVVELNFEDGRRVCCTPDHVFNTNRHKGSGYKCEAANLKGEFVRASRMEPIESQTDNLDFYRGYIKGVTLGDASYCINRKGNHRVYLSCCDKEMADTYSQWINKLYGKKSHVRVAKRKTKKAKKVYRVSCSGHAQFQELPKNHSEERGFIAGFFDSEGSVNKRGNAITISQKDKKILCRVAAIIELHGISCKIDELKNGMSHIRINGGHNVTEFLNHFQPKIQRKIDRAFSKEKRQLKALECTKVSFCPVTQDVVNMMTWSGNFFANGLLVDQCDTKFTWHAKPQKVIPIKEVLEKTGKAKPTYASILPQALKDETIRLGANGAKRWLVVVTGGEPLEQSDGLAEYLWHLSNDTKHPHIIQIETSGCGQMSRFNNRSTFNNLLHFCLSPKVGVGMRDTPLNHPANAFDSIKLPIETETDISKFLPYLERHPSASVTLQPVADNKGGTEGSAEACIELARNNGWSVSFQVHKLIGAR